MSHTSKEPPSQYAAGDLPSNPPEGTVAYDKTNQKMVAFKNSSWGDFGGSGGVGSTTYVRDNVAGVIDQIQGDIPDDWKKFDTSLKGLVIGTSCKSIGSFAFGGCTSLTGSLVIPDSITSIGSSAFDALYGLTGPLTIGSGVKTVGDYVFFDSNYTFINCYTTRDVLNKVKLPVKFNVTIHVRSDDDTWTAGSGQTLGTTQVTTGITVIKDL